MEQERRAKRETYMPYTSAEEQSLMQMKEVGKSWAEIKKAFSNRTKKALQSYWKVGRSRSMMIPAAEGAEIEHEGAKSEQWHEIGFSAEAERRPLS